MMTPCDFLCVLIMHVMTSIQVIIIGSNTYGHLGILEPFTYIE